MKDKINLIQNLNIGNNGLKYYIDVYYKNDIVYSGLILSKKIL